MRDADVARHYCNYLMSKGFCLLIAAYRMTFSKILQKCGYSISFGVHETNPRTCKAVTNVVCCVLVLLSSSVNVYCGCLSFLKRGM